MEDFKATFNKYSLPTKHHTKLNLDEKLDILECQKKETRFERIVDNRKVRVTALLCTVCDEKQQIYKIFLPERYCEAFTDDIMQKINMKQIKVSVIYKGAFGAKNSAVFAVQVNSD